MSDLSVVGARIVAVASLTATWRLAATSRARLAPCDATARQISEAQALHFVASTAFASLQKGQSL